ncbi:MAG: type IV pilus twitching motility protein PilT [Bdellovibrionales bacterium]
MELDHLLRYAMENGASDLHLKHGSLPMIRKHGQLRTLADNLPEMTNPYIKKLAYEVMTEIQRQEFENEKEIDIAHGISGVGRFRINIFLQRGSISMVIRSISFNVPSFQELNLPPVLSELAEQERGLVLVTGVTGSGKSTTMASLVSAINNKFNKHIVTIEDPIEYLISDKKSIISQREIGIDAVNFSKALRAALRQDPDVIMIGEMRDRQTIETALMAAETGHLVISTLHTSNTRESIGRILSFFDSQSHQHIRNQLANNLKAIISQRLARKANGTGYIPAVEIMINNARVGDMIKNPDKTDEIQTAIEESGIGYQMQSFDQSLIRLFKSAQITKDEAYRLTNNKADLELRLKGIKPVADADWSDFHSEDDKRDPSGTAWDDIPALELEQSINQAQKSAKKEDSKGKSKKKTKTFGIIRNKK